MSVSVFYQQGDRIAFPLKLLLIDPDPIYRAGLGIVLSKFTDLQIVAEAENIQKALQALIELTNNVSSGTDLGGNLVLLLGLDFSVSSQMLELQCRQLKTHYPNLPVLLLTYPLQPRQLTAVRAMGVDGYCPKGIAVTELVTAIKQVAAGQWYWVEDNTARGDKRAEEAGGVRRSGGENIIQNPSWKVGRERHSPQRGENTHGGGSENRHRPLSAKSRIENPFTRLRHHLRISGLRQIDTSLAQVSAKLQPGLSVLEQAMLAGQRRELLASRWLVNQLLLTSEEKSQLLAQEQGRQARAYFPPVVHRSVGRENPFEDRGDTGDKYIFPRPSSLAKSPSSLFASVREKLEFSLENLTRVPLEIDILREGKKRELLYLILQKIEDILTDMRLSQVQSNQLVEMHSTIMRDLWQATTEDFFGKYSTFQVGDRQLQIVNILLQDATIVQTAILDKIPLAIELFSYLLFETALVIDNISLSYDSPEAQERAELILQNLLIGVANGVVQPLLNNFATLEIIKQNYYDKRLISTREIERFRNNLSWKYRIETYIEQPKEIFESRYEMFLFVSRGIAKTSIYAPRSQELARLSGIPLVVTLALEFRDAIAPRLRAVIESLGNGVVYILTQVVGRAIGLIGRGILQGLGGFPEGKNKKL